MQPVQIDGYDTEIDDYSIADGVKTTEIDSSGGSAVLRGRIGETSVTVTVTAASLRLALGQALMVLLAEEPPPTLTSLSITGYVDGEVGRFAELHRETQPT